MRARPFLLIVVASAAIAAACSGGGHHGGTTPSPTPTPGAPASVTAVPGFHQLAISWSPVAAASDYRVFVSTSPIVSDTALTPTATNLPHFTATGLTNWTPYHVRVQADDNGRLGPLSDEIVATPSGGILVADVQSAGSYSLVAARSDETNVRVYEIPEGHLDQPLGYTPQVTMTAFLWSEGGNPATAVGWADGSTRLPYAEQSGHGYLFLGFVSGSGRAVYGDRTIATSAVQVVSFALDGTDRRVLTSACTDLGFGQGAANGIAFQCHVAGVLTGFVSDGVSPAIQLTGEAEELGIGPTGGYFHSSTTGEMLFQPFAGGTQKSIGTGAVDEELIAVGATRLFLQAQGASSFALESTDFDGGNQSFVAQGATAAFHFDGITGDADANLVRDPTTAREFLARFGFAASNSDVSGGAADDMALFLQSRTGILVRPTGADWRLFAFPSGAPVATLSGTAGTAPTLIGNLGSNALLYGGTSLYAVDGSAATSTLLSATADPHADLFPDGVALWNDAGATTMHRARVDGTQAATLPDGKLDLGYGITDDGRRILQMFVGTGATAIYTLAPDDTLSLVLGSDGTAVDTVFWMR